MKLRQQIDPPIAATDHLKQTNVLPPAADNSESLQTPDQEKWAYKLPLEVASTEPLHVSSRLDESDEATLCKESATKGLPFIEPCKEHTEPDPGIRTRSRRLDTWPSYLKEFVAYTTYKQRWNMTSVFDFLLPVVTVSYRVNVLDRYFF